MLWTAAFWKGAAERAMKTAAQVLAAIFVVGVPILDIDIRAALSLVATAVVASLLTSILSADFVAGVPAGEVHPFHVVMDAPDETPTRVKDLTRDYSLMTGPAWDAASAMPAAAPTDLDARAAARAAKIARARGESQ